MDQELTAGPDGRFAVELEEAAGTGYSWTPAALPPGIQLEGDEMTPAEPSPGATRRHVFRFAASGAGRYQIDFALKRSWEEQAVDNRRVQVQVGG